MTRKRAGFWEALLGKEGDGKRLFQVEQLTRAEKPALWLSWCCGWWGWGGSGSAGLENQGFRVLRETPERQMDRGKPRKDQMDHAKDGGLEAIFAETLSLEVT